MTTPSYKLKQRLAASMAAVTGLALAGLIVGMVGFHAVAWHYLPVLLVAFDDPDKVPDNVVEALPGWYEWAALSCLWLLGTLSTLLAVNHLARRLNRPLDAVALAARHLTAGDLNARAQVDGPVFEETKQLVDDFNAMARQLALADSELRLRNATIAHELRTPLTILQGRLQGLADGVFQPEEAIFRRLADEASRLGRVVDDLHIMSLVNIDRLALHLEQVDLAREAAAVIALIGGELKAAGVDLHADLHPVEIRGDGARIRQALLALLENVHQHAAPGRALVETRAAQDWSILSVRDNGPGFPAGSGDQVFKPFWRADSPRSRKGRGSGLGLAVVRAIAEAHGGVAVVRAGTYGGAIVEVRLPYSGPMGES
jgi:two-component system, OmpR family, sensor histidine kinase AdeS